MSESEKEFLELLVKSIRENITPEERDLLNELMERDPESRVLYGYLNSHYDSEANLEAEIVYEKTRPVQLDAHTQRSSLFGRYRVWISTIAAFFLLICGYWYFWAKTESIDRDGNWQTIETGRGERKFIKLGDGTEVWLNNDSQLQVAKGYGQQHRKMKLIGEGYFSVSTNEELPLVIQVYDTEVKVLGTVFNLRSYPEDEYTITSLIKGRVNLKLTNDLEESEYILQPGDCVEVPRVVTSAVESSNMEKALPVSYKKVEIKDNQALDMMWVENKLVFNGDSLKSMCRKLERWYNKKIIIKNQDLENQVFSGVFQEQYCEDVLEILKNTGVKLNYYMQKDTIFIE